MRLLAPTTSDLYGRVVSTRHVRDAVHATILAWADTYVLEAGRQFELPDLRPIRHFGQFAPGDLPDKEPGCVIVAPGTVAAPERRGDGTFTGIWGVGVGVIVADATVDAAVRRAEPYAAALRALLVQQGSLGGFAQETTWVNEEVTPLTYERDRVVATSSLEFEVVVEDVLNRWAGPLTVPTDPHTGIDAATAVDVNATLERMRPP